MLSVLSVKLPCRLQWLPSGNDSFVMLVVFVDAGNANSNLLFPLVLRTLATVIMFANNRHTFVPATGYCSSLQRSPHNKGDAGSWFVAMFHGEQWNKPIWRLPTLGDTWIVDSSAPLKQRVLFQIGEMQSQGLFPHFEASLQSQLAAFFPSSFVLFHVLQQMNNTRGSYNLIC